jgi:hypothetical protein
LDERRRNHNTFGRESLVALNVATTTPAPPSAAARAFQLQLTRIDKLKSQLDALDALAQSHRLAVHQQVKPLILRNAQCLRDMALLLDAQGACSWADGCGVPRINQDAATGAVDAAPSAMIAFFLPAEVAHGVPRAREGRGPANAGRLPGQEQDGPARGLRKRLVRAWVQTYAAGQFVVQGDAVAFVFQGDDVDTAPTPINGISTFRLSGVSHEAQFDLTVEQAQKVTVLSVTREVSVGG